MMASIGVLAPPSSPPLSPTLTEDSSAPPSPRDDIFIPDDRVSHELPLLDPFSGSVKADRPHPSYEKKSIATPPDTPNSSASTAESAEQRRDESPLSRIRFSGSHVRMSEPLWTPEESRENAGWEQTFSTIFAIDNATGMEEDGLGTQVLRSGRHIVIDRSNQGLTFVPPSIADLSNLVKLSEREDEAAAAVPKKPVQRTLARSATAPPTRSLFARADALAKVTSANAKLFSGSGPEHEIRLFLRGNAIRFLPNELFTLSNLTVLTLSNNVLEILPPEIVHLANLKELNVANNKLRYLPAEIITMEIDKLTVQPNPWLPRPQCPSSKTCDSSHIASPTTALIGRFVPLAELALRRLFAPAHELGYCSPLDEEGRQPLLHALYGTPLPPEFSSLLPPPITAVFDACAPGSIPQPVMKARKPPKLVQLPRPTKDLGDVCRYWEGVTGVGVCPSPRHLESRAEGYQKPVFVHPAEERYTWQRTAGKHALGGVVCFLWRGCLEGCLDFLDEEDSAAAAEDVDMDSGFGGFRAVSFA
ncbi:hypothetical protein OE88DRAFT_1503689 [Heliocybe sulcata]|uniref:L domain-like protein n=1 Tax=Heliocybe sulcata TaxID=5364 RepID=A0A5C3N4A0_9AGAM|nr:hypothetical protein OE88DRAFT_1503689 [Heliocybe sulcata]